MTGINGEHGEIQDLAPEYQELLQKYIEIFAIPQDLPPPRSHDHKIPFKMGSQPISARPYRSPIAHKEEIEKSLQKCWQQG